MPNFWSFLQKMKVKKNQKYFLHELLKEYLEKEKEKENNKIILNETKKKKKNNCSK